MHLYHVASLTRQMFAGRIPNSLRICQAADMSKLSHKERTAADRRQPDLHRVIIHKIDQVNAEVRLIQLRNVKSQDLIKARTLEAFDPD